MKIHKPLSGAVLAAAAAICAAAGVVEDTDQPFRASGRPSSQSDKPAEAGLPVPMFGSHGMVKAEQARLIGFGPQWDLPTTDSVSNVPLALALARLRPPEQTLELDLQGDVGAQEVSWASGATRRQVLNELAQRHGLTMRIVGGKLSVVRGAPASSAVAVPMKKFEVRLSDMRLHVALQRWARETGVRLRWDADRHVLISAPMTFEATDALQAIGMALATPGIANSAYPMEVCEYPNTPVLLRITRQGEQAKDCPN